MTHLPNSTSATWSNQMVHLLLAVNLLLIGYETSLKPLTQLESSLEQSGTQLKTILPNTAEASFGLGSLSAKYESSGNPGTIANTKGDLGGKSYGTYQLTTNSGHAQKFANQYGGALKGLKPGTSAFDKAWQAEASKNPDAFAKAQHSYIAKNHYEPALNAFQSVTGIKKQTQMPMAVQNAIWSIGVQHGAGGARNIFKNAGIKTTDSAETILKKVYNERMKVDKYFSGSSKEIQASVKKRFQNELNDALSTLNARG